jgi:hypothetical protein
MPSQFHTRLDFNRQRFEELTTETVLLEAQDTEFPIQASPIKKRPWTMTTMGATLVGERFWWGISVDQLRTNPENPATAFLPDEGMTIQREDDSVYRVIREDQDSPYYKYTTANHDRIIVCTIREL